MRRRPNNQGGGGSYNNQHRRPRFQGSGGQPQGGGHHRGGPRRNYAQLREKYLQQARDALASGDRVLAENYYQHADHCYRMLAEEGYFNRHQPAAQPNGDAQPQDHQPEEISSGNTNELPAFITATHEQNKPVDPVTIQNWEERDAEA